MSFCKSKRPFSIVTANGSSGKDFSKEDSNRLKTEKHSKFSQSFHNSINQKALEKAIDRRDFALSTALLMNEGYSFDFSLIASLQLVGGNA